MTFRDIAEKGKPETDNLIVLKIVLRCQNSSHTFSNLFNKKPESASFRCVVLEHRPLVSWLFDSRDREVLFDRTLEDCLKMSSLRYPGLKQSITLTYGQEVGGLCHQPCQTQFGISKSPQFGRGSWSEHIRSTNWLTLQENIHSSPEIQAGVCKFDIINNGLPGPGLMAENRLYSLLIDVPQV